MPDVEKKSWLRRRVEGAIRGGLTRAYQTVRVDPERFLIQLRIAYGLPIAGFRGVYSLEISRLDDVATSVIRSGMKLAAVEGAGFGLGGILTIVPDLGILSAITMRTIQKLSLTAQLDGRRWDKAEDRSRQWDHERDMRIALDVPGLLEVSSGHHIQG